MLLTHSQRAVMKNHLCRNDELNNPFISLKKTDWQQFWLLIIQIIYLEQCQTASL